jgi:diguanylate cyclase (GGDEF)-like protein
VQLSPSRLLSLVKPLRSAARLDPCGIEHDAEIGRRARSRYKRRIAELEARLLRAQTTIQELAAKVETDALLDMPNRRGFERELKRALGYVERYGSGTAVIFIDLDDFKSINDRYGHLAGDVVLKAVAVTLRGMLRTSDVFARFGGDEFAVLPWNVNQINARTKALALEKAIADLQIPHSFGMLSVRASAGLAMPRPGHTFEQVIEKADEDMYGRKRSKHCVTG